MYEFVLLVTKEIDAVVFEPKFHAVRRIETVSYGPFRNYKTLKKISERFMRIKGVKSTQIVSNNLLLPPLPREKTNKETMRYYTAFKYLVTLKKSILRTDKTLIKTIRNQQALKNCDIIGLRILVQIVGCQVNSHMTAEDCIKLIEKYGESDNKKEDLSQLSRAIIFATSPKHSPMLS